MTDSLEAELDQLFRLPVAELIEARNALADRLKRAGDKANAARIKAIKRPAPVAWALNQVHFEQPALLERARLATAELRELHARPGLEPKRLSASVEQQRVAMQAIVDAALRAGRGAGLSENALQPRKVFTTVQAWLAGKGAEAPGRMTQELEASGFDAFAGMTLPAVAAPLAAPLAVRSAPPDAAPPAAEEHAAREAAEQAARVAAERARLAAEALEQVRVRQAEQSAAERGLAQAQISVREAERQLAELRAMVEQRAHELERRTRALDEARARHAQAEADAAATRAPR